MATGQFEILGHNLKNVVSSALLEYGIPREMVLKFSFNFNEKYCEESSFEHSLVKEDEILIDQALENSTFKKIINRKFNRHLRKHAILLEACKMIEDTFSPLMLIKIFFNRMYIMMDILCVLYVIKPSLSIPP